MPLLDRATSLLRNIVNKKHVEEDLDEELRSHVALLVEEKVNEGMKPEQALRAALNEMGGVEQVKEEVRDVRIGTTIENVWKDLRYAFRGLARNRTYSIVVIIALALGIGAVTSVFSVANAVFLKPYGSVNSDEWVYIWEHRTKSQSLNQISVSMPNFRDWKGASVGVFSDMVVWLPWSYTASGTSASEPERIRAAVISPEIFSAVAAVPAAGRLLLPEDTVSSERRVVVSYEFWKRAYGADSTLPGKKLTLNGVSHTVVGVAPPGFSFPPEDQVDVWTVLPETVLSSADRSARSFRVADYYRPIL